MLYLYISSEDVRLKLLDAEVVVMAPLISCKDFGECEVLFWWRFFSTSQKTVWGWWSCLIGFSCRKKSFQV